MTTVSDPVVLRPGANDAGELREMTRNVYFAAEGGNGLRKAARLGGTTKDEGGSNG